jgi:hypothetical protein
MTTPIHHINYEFNSTGLSPAECSFHARDVQEALAEHFGLPYDAVRTKFGPNLEPVDVRVMRSAGSTHDYDRNIEAMKVVMPLLQDIRYKPAVVADLRAPGAGHKEVLIQLVRPPQILGV